MTDEAPHAGQKSSYLIPWFVDAWRECLPSMVVEWRGWPLWIQLDVDVVLSTRVHGRAKEIS